jgi:hypothetical protein
MSYEVDLLQFEMERVDTSRILSLSDHRDGDPNNWTPEIQEIMVRRDMFGQFITNVYPAAEIALKPEDLYPEEIAHLRQANLCTGDDFSRAQIFVAAVNNLTDNILTLNDPDFAAIANARNYIKRTLKTIFIFNLRYPEGSPLRDSMLEKLAFPSIVTQMPTIESILDESYDVETTINIIIESNNNGIPNLNSIPPVLINC